MSLAQAGHQHVKLDQIISECLEAEGQTGAQHSPRIGKSALEIHNMQLSVTLNITLELKNTGS